METIPCKESARLMECLEASGKIKKIKEPSIFAHNAERFLAGEMENSEGQRSEEKEGNYELEELPETIPSEPGLISECYQILEEERVSLVNHTRSMGSPSKKENTIGITIPGDFEKNKTANFNGPDFCPMQVELDISEPSYPPSSDTIQQNLSLRKWKKWARQVRTNSCFNTTKVDSTKRKFNEDADKTLLVNPKKKRSLEFDNGVVTELQNVLDTLTQTVEAAEQPCRSL
ncbi:hypothetical protein U1Q18_036371 [Sarracenia purpurea var. burkii]